MSGPSRPRLLLILCASAFALIVLDVAYRQWMGWGPRQVQSGGSDDEILDPAAPVLRQRDLRVAQGIDSARMHALVETLTSNPSRIPGYPGYARARDAVLQAFRDAGIETMGTQRYEVVAPVEIGAEVFVRPADPNVDGPRGAFRLHALWPNLVVSPQTPADGLSGPLIYAARGHTTSYDGKDVQGAIVVLDFDSGSRWVNAAALGANAVIFIEPENALRGEAEKKFLQAPLNMPRYWLAREHAEELLGWVRRGARATVKATVSLERVEAENVYAVIPGTEKRRAEGDREQRQIAIVGSHFDSISIVPALAPGADGAGSVAALVELAHYLKQNPPRRTTLLLADGAHFLGLAGMRQFYRLVNMQGDARAARGAYLELRRTIQQSLFLAVLAEWEQASTPEGAAGFRQRVAELSAEQVAIADKHDIKLERYQREFLSRPVSAARKQLREWIETRIGRIDDTLRFARLEDNQPLIKRKEAERVRLRRVRSRILGTAGRQSLSEAESLATSQAFGLFMSEMRAQVGKQIARLDTLIERHRHNQKLRDLLDPYEEGRGFYVGLDLSSRSARLGLFYKGWLYNERGKDHKQKYGRLGQEYNNWARIVAGSVQSDFPAVTFESLWADTLTDAGGREWYTFLPGRPAFDVEVFAHAGTLHARIPFNAVGFGTVGDGRPYVDTPHDTLGRVQWANVVTQARLCLPLAVRMIDAPGIPDYKFGAERYQRFSVLDGRAVMKGSARSIFASFPVSDAVIVSRYQFSPTRETKTYMGVRNDFLAMTDEFGDYEIPGVRFWGPLYVEAYKLDPETGRVSHALDKGTLAVPPGQPWRNVVNEDHERIRPLMFECRPLEIVGLIDPRYLNQLTNPRIIDARRESQPIQFGSAAPVQGEPVSILFGERDARLKVTYSAGQLGVRMALLNIDPVRAKAGDTHRKVRTGEGFDLRKISRVPMPSYQAARDLYWLDHWRIQRLRVHGIDNQRLANSIEWVSVEGTGADACVLDVNDSSRPVVHLLVGRHYAVLNVKGRVSKAVLTSAARIAAERMAAGKIGTGRPMAETVADMQKQIESGMKWKFEGDPELLESLEDLESKAHVRSRPFREYGWRRAYRSGTGGDAALELHEFASTDGARQLMTYRQFSAGTGLHDRTRLSLLLADRAKRAKQYSRFVDNARQAKGTESRAYPDVRSTADDTILGVIFYMFLVLPFSFFLERLLFGFPRVEKQILAFFLIFITMFFLLRLVHPAFELTAAPTMVLLAFVILALSLIVISIIYGRFNTEIKALQQEVQGAQSADVNRLSATAVAVALGIGNMRRRKVRTALTCATIILLTFTALSFTSVVRSVRSTKILRDNQPAYEGMLIRETTWGGLEEEVYHILENQYGREHTVCPRAWYLSEDPKKPTKMEVSLAGAPGQRRVAEALLGVIPSEAELLDLDKALLRVNKLPVGRWFAPGDSFACLMSEEFAKKLGVDIAQVKAGGAAVTMAGQTFQVIGIVDDDKFDGLLDLDGEGLCPVNYKAMEDVKQTEQQQDAALSMLGDGSGQKYEHLLVRTVVIVPFDTLMNMNGRLRSVAVRFGRGAPVAPLSGDAKARADVENESIVSNLLIHLAKNVYAGLDGRTYLYASTEAISLAGFTNLIVPITIAGFIILNTMLGSVYERNQEIAIYSALGLAPSHVSALFLAEAMVYATLGAISGYLLGQGVAWTLTHVEMFASLFEGLSLNYSSVSTVVVTVVVMASVILSTVYPSIMAGRLAAPASERRWEVPAPVDDEIFIELPFTFSAEQVKGVCAFLFEYFSDHTESTIGRFYALEVDFSPVEGNRGPGYLLYFMCWPAPYDLGVSQEFQLYFVPTEDGPSRVELCLFRVSGDESAWIRINRPLLDALRKQFLLWRTLGALQRQHYGAAGDILAEHVAAGGKAHEMSDPAKRPLLQAMARWEAEHASAGEDSDRPSADDADEERSGAVRA